MMNDVKKFKMLLLMQLAQKSNWGRIVLVETIEKVYTNFLEDMLSDNKEDVKDVKATCAVCTVPDEDDDCPF